MPLSKATTCDGLIHLYTPHHNGISVRYGAMPYLTGLLQLPQFKEKLDVRYTSLGHQRTRFMIVWGRQRVLLCVVICFNS